MKYLVVSALWAAYCALHSFLISISVTNFLTRKLKNYYAFYRLFYIVISLALLIPLINYTDSVDSQAGFVYQPPWDTVRMVLVIFSLAVFFWAFFFNYDSLSFFGIRQIMNLMKPGSVDSAGIKKKGLLAITRHPMYFALLIFLWSGVFSLMDIIINLVLTAYIIIGTYLEEKKLILEFGDAYLEYRHEVPMLIPFMKKKKPLKTEVAGEDKNQVHSFHRE